jgi:hypothetical protein
VPLVGIVFELNTQASEVVDEKTTQLACTHTVTGASASSSPDETAGQRNDVTVLGV